MNRFARDISLTVIALIAFSCGGGSESGTTVRKGNPNSDELFDRSYGYLMKGDPEFGRFAPNYAALRPFTRDTAMAVESRSEHDKTTNPNSDFNEYFYLRIHRPMTVRMIVADSTGAGLITYEFPSLALGEYTIGSKGWPVPQVELLKGHTSAYVFFVGDQRFRTRYKLGLNEKYHLTYMPQPAPPAEGS